MLEVVKFENDGFNGIALERPRLMYPIDDYNEMYDTGWGNGYVIIPKEHPLYKVDYNELYDTIDVHGGLTFSRFVEAGQQPWDLSKKSWVIGFDTDHYGDTLENCPKEYVIDEIKNMIEQLKKLDK